MYDDDEDIEGKAPASSSATENDALWDLARFVELHPEDYEERWRLAKKMYLSWEYRHALDHLLVLKNEWTPRLNVRRYLAATYYRLGRYDDASAELEEAIGRWPEDVGLREQLARVKEIAGDRAGASAVWEDIAELSPAHPTAHSAIKRLLQKPGSSPREDLGIADSDSGVNLKIGVVCPQCGAQNSNDEARCWQCNEPLSHVSPPPMRRAARKNAPVVFGPSIEMLVTITGIVGMVFAAISVYLSIRLMLGDRGTGAHIGYSDLWDLYQHGMGRTRLALGAALYIGFPAALWLAISHLDVKLRVPPAFLTLTAFATAGIAYVCTWLPANALWLGALMPPLASALLIIGAAQIPRRQAVSVWAMHLGIVAVIVLAVFLSAERLQFGRFYNPLTEIPRVLAYINTASPGAGDAPFIAEDTIVPIAQRMRWESTGSGWLDARAGETVFTVTSKHFSQLIFEIKDSTGTVEYKDLRSERWTTTFPVKPNEVYEIFVRGPEGVQATLEVSGLMRAIPAP
jgi:tetratricopeptide (TPR) repeat protein